MADAEQVVGALAGLGKSRHAAPLPQPAQEGEAARDQLVGVALVADIEQQPVL